MSPPVPVTHRSPSSHLLHISRHLDTLPQSPVRTRPLGTIPPSIKATTSNIQDSEREFSIDCSTTARRPDNVQMPQVVHKTLDMSSRAAVANQAGESEESVIELTQPHQNDPTSSSSPVVEGESGTKKT